MIAVMSHSCPQNHPCPVVGLCPVDAIDQHGYSAPTVNNEECIECGVCTMSCPAFRNVDDGVVV